MKILNVLNAIAVLLMEKLPIGNMTFKTDYDKWDSELGVSAMADLKLTRPTMDTCMDCHESRKVTTECQACHTTWNDSK